MNANFQRAQAAYDAMLPDDSEAFLDTTEGANWLADAGERLVRAGSCRDDDAMRRRDE